MKRIVQGHARAGETEDRNSFTESRATPSPDEFPTQRNSADAFFGLIGFWARGRCPKTLSQSSSRLAFR